MNMLETGSGRTRLRLAWQWWGSDLHVHIGGGQDHIGATALVGREPSGEAYARVLAVPTHKEGQMVLQAAERLHAALGGNVCVTGGVHLEKITRDEIALILQNAQEGIEGLVRVIRGE
jgi:hypothetical protein